MDTNHFAHLTKTLNEIPALFADLATNLPNTPQPATGERTTTSRHHPLPFRDNVSVARIHLEGVLVSWARLVAEKQNVSLPVSRDDVATFLARHLPWVVGQDFGDVFADEVLSAVSGARATLVDHSRALTIGSCPAPTVDGVPCSGVLLVNPSDRFIACPTCGESWVSSDWERLGKLLGCDPVGLVDAYAGSARLYDLGFVVSPAAIRKWAERGRVARHGSHKRRTLYDLTELVCVAQASLVAM